MNNKQKTDDDEPLVKFEIGKGWKKIFKKFKAWQIAVLLLVVIICILLIEFLKWLDDSSLKFSPNLLAIVIVIGLLIVYFIVTYAIDAFLEKDNESDNK